MGEQFHPEASTVLPGDTAFQPEATWPIFIFASSSFAVQQICIEELFHIRSVFSAAGDSTDKVKLKTCFQS